MICTLASLLPTTLFTGSGEWLLWVLAFVAIPALAFGADRLVEAAVRIAKAAGIPTVIIGATIVSLGTTTPEAVVSVRAALGGSPDMALGNAVGSIICDTALIFGLCCLITRLPMDKKMLNRQGLVQLGSGVLLCVIAAVAWAISGDINSVFIGRPVGLTLLAMLGFYMWLSISWSRKGSAQNHATIEMLDGNNDTNSGSDNAPKKEKVNILLNLAIMIFGLALVVFGSELLIGSATEICHRHHVPKAVIAVTLVAFGTSLPELVTALAAVAKGHSELLVGNIVGADILNVLFVVGASATAVPLKVEPVFFILLLPVMLAVLVLLRLYVVFTSGDKFHRWQGAPLLLIYIIFLTISVTVFGMSH